MVPWDTFLTFMGQLILIILVCAVTIGGAFDWWDKRKANKKDQ